MTGKPKIAVIGAGGVGGYFGALLARGGEDVRFLARGAHLKAIVEKGLTVKSCRGDFNVRAAASDDPSRLGLCDLLLFCVKSFDTEEMAHVIKPMTGPDSIIISLQNGVENEEILGRILGKEKVMGGVAFVGSRLEAPGVVLHTAAGSLAIGEMEGGKSQRGVALQELFEGAGLEVSLSEDVRKTMWRKMLWNCGFNAVTALTGSLVSHALSLTETRAVIRAAMNEVLDVARGLGVALRDNLPEKTIAHTEAQGEIKTSMLVDLENGRRTEIEALNGAISRFGRKLSLATPVNDTLYGLVKALDGKNCTSGDFRP